MRTAAAAVAVAGVAVEVAVVETMELTILISRLPTIRIMIMQMTGLVVSVEEFLFLLAASNKSLLTH